MSDYEHNERGGGAASAADDHHGGSANPVVPEQRGGAERAGDGYRRAAGHRPQPLHGQPAAGLRGLQVEIRADQN